MIDAESYVFDFEKEVEQAFETFPQLRRNTIFMDATDTPLKPYFGSEETAQHPALKRLVKDLEDWFHEGGVSVRLAASIKQSSWLHGILLSPHSLIIDPPDIDRARAKDHEMGHVLGANDPFLSEIYQENVADAFSAIRRFHCFGNDPQALSLVSLFRSHKVVAHNNPSYLTMPTINQIISDSKFIDFESMSPEETIEAAKNYAVIYTPSVLEEQAAFEFTSKIKHLWHNGSTKNYVELLASTALSSSNPFIFEAFGKSIIRPFINNPEGVTLRGEHIQFDEKTRNNFRDQFAARAGQLGLYDIASEMNENKAEMLTSATVSASARVQASFSVPTY